MGEIFSWTLCSYVSLVINCVPVTVITNRLNYIWMNVCLIMVITLCGIDTTCCTGLVLIMASSVAVCRPDGWSVFDHLGGAVSASPSSGMSTKSRISLASLVIEVPSWSILTQVSVNGNHGNRSEDPSPASSCTESSFEVQCSSSQLVTTADRLWLLIWAWPPALVPWKPDCNGTCKIFAGVIRLL